MTYHQTHSMYKQQLGLQPLSSIIYLSNLFTTSECLSEIQPLTLTYQNQHQQLMCMSDRNVFRYKEEKYVPYELTGFICFVQQEV